MKTTLPVTEVCVLLQDGKMDMVYLKTDLPTNVAGANELSFAACLRQGTGAAWVREHLGVEPEVIDGRVKKPRP